MPIMRQTKNIIFIKKSSKNNKETDTFSLKITCFSEYCICNVQKVYTIRIVNELSQLSSRCLDLKGLKIRTKLCPFFVAANL